MSWFGDCWRYLIRSSTVFYVVLPVKKLSDSSRLIWTAGSTRRRGEATNILNCKALVRNEMNNETRSETNDEQLQKIGHHMSCMMKGHEFEVWILSFKRNFEYQMCTGCLLGKLKSLEQLLEREELWKLCETMRNYQVRETTEWMGNCKKICTTIFLVLRPGKILQNYEKQMSMLARSRLPNR